MSGSADPVEITRTLIRCPSVTPEEGGALSYLEGLLGAAGFRVHRVTLTGRDTPDVENLYARFGTRGPNLCFAGHTDVVPPGDPAHWRFPPFEAAIHGGLLYGRGAVDMKSGVAAFTAAALDLAAEHGDKLPGSISLLITGDEEGPAINGTEKLLRWLADRDERLDHCVLGEPSSRAALGDMVKIGRRGSLSGTLTVHGKQGHVGYPHLAENPIPGMARLITALTAEPLDRGSAHFQASNLEVVSVDVGNPAFNVIPAEAKARFNIRFNDLWMPDTLKAEVERRLKAAAGNEVRFSLAFEERSSDSFLTAPGDFVDLVVAAISDATGRTPELSTTGGTSDARFIKDYCPVVEFGLVGTSMHAVDEATPVEEIHALTRVYKDIATRYFDAFGR
ncbi:succinyl-diaminopimelate desuccinylase [Ancylobacter defluvii]|uniref:Succinyl-diaminopimelate desuccinylase n=1 Tax=Ancylobacter defluvii TaxID=1282440 RepID=A0A9W6JZ70_9HYPH|nr:succinyl-diaminopimelate desuccinylase [Ancylobacter defluvii]MBS7588755.1 succinyl-diaminopimelate desuccinylase [Ancylobacter defluvii]GLK84038.1 succinyl-diaminopimelate desuccinylase [Ancylobacter defluvii]